MARLVGVSMTDRIAVGLVEDDRIVGPVLRYPDTAEEFPTFQGVPAEEISTRIREQIEIAVGDTQVAAVGIGMPGVIRGGIIEESPNLQQMKGQNIQCSIADGLRPHRQMVVIVSNDADVMAAGIAATRGQLDRLIRVWTLGNGIGFGRYPAAEGVWEGGHTVVTLDVKETYCGCGGSGHLEGIMGHRAMRLRFLDMEPEEVFASAKSGDARCLDFVKLWHRALAAGTASSIHMDGPGKFYLTGPSARYVDLSLLHVHMAEMVKMSPLQGYTFDVVPGGEEIAIIGAAVHARHALEGA